jgi:hypothetical protein
MSPDKAQVLDLIDDYLGEGSVADALERLNDIIDELIVIRSALRIDRAHELACAEPE